jgi:hypothetical protein
VRRPGGSLRRRQDRRRHLAGIRLCSAMTNTGCFSPGWQQTPVSVLSSRVAAECARFAWRLGRAASAEAPASSTTGRSGGTGFCWFKVVKQEFRDESEDV